MHILHLTPYYAPAYAFGGVTRSVEGMTRALARRGHRVTVLTTDALNQTSRTDAPSDEMLNGVHVIRVRNLSPFLRGRLNLSTPYRLRDVAKLILPDVDLIHCHEFRTVENLLLTPLAGEHPLVLSPHGTLALHTGRSGVKTLWDSLLSPMVARRFRHVVGLTQDEADEAKALWETFAPNALTPNPSPSGRGGQDISDLDADVYQPAYQKPSQVNIGFSVIPNGVDPDEYANLSGRESFRQRYELGDAPVCLFMGRLHERKGIGILVEAFRQVDIPDARLVIVGPDEGMLAALQPLLDERMTVTGYLGGADRLAALAAADMLALPAVGEGLPMVVLEAMAAGLPVIVSPGCHLPEVAQYGAGLEADAAVKPLAEALNQILSDEAARQQMGQAARTLVQERFTWDNIALQLEQLYAGLLQGI